MTRRNAKERPARRTRCSMLSVVETLDPRAMLAGVGPESWSTAGPTFGPLGTGPASSSGALLTCSSPTPGSSGTSLLPGVALGSGGSPSGGVLWLSSTSGSGVGSSPAGSSGAVDTNGQALSSQSQGGTFTSSRSTGSAVRGSAANGGDLWLSYSVGSGAGASPSGSSGVLSTNGPALSSQSPGRSGGGLGANTNAGAGGTLSGADLWQAYGSGTAADAWASGFPNGGNPNGAVLAAQYASGSGVSKATLSAATGSGGQVFGPYDHSQTKAEGAATHSGSNGLTTLSLTDAQSSAELTRLVYQPGSDDGPVVVSGVWTGDDGGWEVVQVADTVRSQRGVGTSAGDWLAARGPSRFLCL